MRWASINESPLVNKEYLVITSNGVIAMSFFSKNGWIPKKFYCYPNKDDGMITYWMDIELPKKDKNNWVSIEEGLPEIKDGEWRSDVILVACDNSLVTLSTWAKFGWTPDEFYTCKRGDGKVTHWKPLPEFPDGFIVRSYWLVGIPQIKGLTW